MGQRVCKRDSLFIERITSTADESSQGKNHASEYAVCRYHSLPGRGRVARAPSGARASDMTDKPQLKSKAKVQRSNGRIENSPKVPLPSGNGLLGSRAAYAGPRGHSHGSGFWSLTPCQLMLHIHVYSARPCRQPVTEEP